MNPRPPSAKTRHRPALILLVVIAAAACLALGWWQWSRFESNSGTAQNLGYALQWPAFAVAVLWGYRRFVVMEADPEMAKKERVRNGPTEIAAGILPERPSATDPSVAVRADTSVDPSLTDYNRYLSDLDGGSPSAPRPKDSP